MRQFDLEKYLEDPSRKVVTRDGRDVRIICTDRKTQEGLYPIIALIKDETGEEYESFKENGHFKGVSNSPLDLFFAEASHVGWVNVYKSSVGLTAGGGVWKTEAEAKEVACDLERYVATVKIEWED